MAKMVELTKSERDFLEVVMSCLKSPPEIDVAQISKVLNIKPKSVTNKWWEVRKKLWPTPAQAEAQAATPVGGGKGGKRKRPSGDVEPDDDEDPSTPPAKATKTARSKKTQTPTVTESSSPDAKIEQDEDEHKFKPAVPTGGVNHGQPPVNYGSLLGHGQFINPNETPTNMSQPPGYHNGLPANYQQPIHHHHGLPLISHYHHPVRHNAHYNEPPADDNQDEDSQITHLSLAEGM